MGKSAIAAVLLVLVLSGCSTGGSTTAAPAGSSSAPAVIAHAALVANTHGPIAITAVDDPPTPESGMIAHGDEVLLGFLRGPSLQGVSTVPSADLLAAARYACDLFAQGQTVEQMDVIQGDEAFLAAKGLPANRNDRSIAALASQTLCVEYNINN